MAARFTINDMQAFAHSNGGKCMSKEYINEKTILAWMCKRGHTWDAPYSLIRQGYWCVQCSKGSDKQERLHEMQQIAIKRGGKCLSAEYINNHTQLQWECSKGHTWSSKPNVIKTGSWCPECAHRKKLTIELMHAMAAEKGGKCLSSTYINGKTKLKWQCSRGHTWLAMPISIRIGQWCRICQYKNVGEKLRLDINDLKVLAEMHEGKLLSEVYENNYSPLQWQCNKGHIWSTPAQSIMNSHSWCPYCAGLAKFTTEQMNNIAATYGGECLTPYKNSRTKLKWKCKKGHTWMGTITRIHRGKWCPYCSGFLKVIKT